MSPLQDSPELPGVPVIIGTAGHIDHGKSSLIRALTGTDPDRLKEEKERGITIELGFAFLNDRIAFIDVPGHEKFVKHMAAGAATVDYAMLIIAADDGIMPQTREHLDILTLMGVNRGLVVVTKADLVEPDWLDLVREEIREGLADSIMAKAPLITVDSLSGRGIDDLRGEIFRLAAEKRVAAGRGFFRLPVDRVFTMKGFGTVVTGSVLSGSAQKGDELELMPEGRRVRVKGMQSQGKAAELVLAGQRAAINLPNVTLEEVQRGDVLAQSGVLRATRLLDASLTLLTDAARPLEHRQRVRLHLGTAEILARIILLDSDTLAPGETRPVQIRLETPTAVLRHDRFVMRQYSPQRTIGGGVILDANPKPHRRNRPDVLDRLRRLAATDTTGPVLAALEQVQLATLHELSVKLSQEAESLKPILEDLLLRGEAVAFTAAEPHYAPAGLFRDFHEAVARELAAFHAANPMRAGMRQGDVLGKLRKRFAKNLLGLFMEYALAHSLFVRPGGDLMALADFHVRLTREQQTAVNDLENALTQGGIAPPAPAELATRLGLSPAELKPLLTYLVDTGRALSLEGTVFFSARVIEQARATLEGLLADGGCLTVAEIRDSLNGTRKHLIPLLNHFDALGWTLREGDLRRAGPNLLTPRERP